MNVKSRITNSMSVVRANTAASKNLISLNIIRVMQSAEKYLASLNHRLRTTEEKLITAIKENDCAYVRQKLMKHPELVEKSLKDSDTSSKTPLGMACYFSSLNVISEIIQAGADVHQIDLEGFTPLMLAVNAGCIQTVTHLLEKHHVNVNQKSSIGNNCSAIAAATGDLKMLKTLMEHGVDIHNKTKSDFVNILMVACCYGKLDVVQFLHAEGIDINEQTIITKQTPLHYAVKGGHVEVVQFLLAKGAKLDLHDLEHHTPLHLAKKNGNRQIINMLIVCGAEDYSEDELPLPAQTDLLSLDNSKSFSYEGFS